MGEFITIKNIKFGTVKSGQNFEKSMIQCELFLQMERETNY